MSKDNESVNEFFNNRFFHTNKKLLCIIGRWPYQSVLSRRIIGMLYHVGIITVVIPELIYFVEVLKDTYKMIDCLPAMILTYGAFVMYHNSIIHFKAMEKILGEIQYNWTHLHDENEYKIFRKYAEEGRLYIIFYLTCVGMSLVTYMLEPMAPKLLDLIYPLNESRPLKNLLEVDYLIDMEKYYVPLYFHGMQAAVMVVFTIMTFDAYFVMIVQNSCCMFTVLGYRIDKIGQDTIKSYSDTVNEELERVVSRKLIECMEYHRDCIRFADTIEDSFTVSWIMQLFVNMVIISVTGVQCITRTDNPEEMMKYVFNATSVIFRLFYVSLPGQKIIDHSSQVHEFISNVAWYDFPPRAKKLLIMMQLRSSRPCSITACKMMPLNFQTYCTMMQTSMSYFTMILSTT